MKIVFIDQTKRHIFVWVSHSRIITSDLESCLKVPRVSSSGADRHGPGDCIDLKASVVCFLSAPPVSLTTGPGHVCYESVVQAGHDWEDRF